MVTLVLVLIMSAYILRREHIQIKQIKKKIDRYE
jgi:hypothetical protein